MKLTCDLCGGALQMNLGGQGATCVDCGLTYSMERLREMLADRAPVKPVPPKPVPPKPVPPMPAPPKPVPSPRHSFDFVPAQFAMPVTGTGADYVSGSIQKGGIGVGDRVYINHDYAHPYTVYCLNDPSLPDAKEGMWTQLHLKKCPRRILKSASTVTGDPAPVANAYNYPGTVYQYFSDLLPAEFSGYEIHTNVPHDKLDIPVSFLLCQGGTPALAVFLIHSKDSKGRSQVRKAAHILRLEGVACIHFYENYRNDAPYVIDRIQSVLG